MGTPAFAVPALQALCADAARYQVVAAYTQPDRPAGRGRRLQSCAVKVAATQLGIATLAPTRLRDPTALGDFAALRCDLAVVAAYGRILPPAFLATPRHGCLNLHASLLPAYRGASPIAHAILHGEAETGISLMQMDAGLDTGPVYAMRRLPIAADDTCGGLTDKLAGLAAALLVEALPSIVAGHKQAVPQAGLGRGEPSGAPLLHKASGALDLRLTAAALARQVRAFSPWPGTFLQKDSQRLGIMRVCELAYDGRAAPGTVLQAGAAGLTVACGGGALRLLEVKPAGKKTMDAAAWLAGHRVEVGLHIAASI